MVALLRNSGRASYPCFALCFSTVHEHFYTGYKGSKEGHKYFAASSLLCMIMAIYTGHKMISGKSRKKKEVSVESVED